MTFISSFTYDLFPIEEILTECTYCHCKEHSIMPSVGIRKL